MADFLCKVIMLKYGWGQREEEVNNRRCVCVCVCVSARVNKSRADIRVSLQICPLTRVMVQIKDQTCSTVSPSEVWCMDIRLWMTHYSLPSRLTVAALTRWMEELSKHLTHIPQSITLVLPCLTLCSHSEQPGWQVPTLTDCRYKVWT